MIWALNSSSQTLSAGATVGLNQVLCRTNDNVVLASNAFQIRNTGWYLCSIQGQLGSVPAVTTRVQLNCQGNIQSNADCYVTIPADGTTWFSFQWPVQVIASADGVATITWTVADAVTANSISASVTKVV